MIYALDSSPLLIKISNTLLQSSKRCFQLQYAQNDIAMNEANSKACSTEKLLKVGSRLSNILKVSIQVISFSLTSL